MRKHNENIRTTNISRRLMVWGMSLVIFGGLLPDSRPILLGQSLNNRLAVSVSQHTSQVTGPSALSYNFTKESREQQQVFQLKSNEYIKAIDSEVITYEHTRTAAQVVHIKNSDHNRAFAIGFKTPIHDNTGVNHIVEHAVFTGSEKYNIKDVFFEMKKKSPNIFMNASTAADMTIYPFSTRNHKDFNNLLDVYLDAVFFPNLQKHRHGFDQEGWHYRVDADDNFHLSGVVYNEMKGAIVAPRRILAMANRVAMFPDTMYIYNAGGNPAEIPNLTYEEFKRTHSEYYVPSNSCAFIYGDVEIEPVLKRLDSYYSRFEKSNNQNISQKQEPFKTVKYHTEFYPAISSHDSYYMSTNFAVGEIDDIKLQLSMGILMDILTGYEESPIRKAFKEEQSSKTLSYDVDSAIPQPMYSIIATDVKKDDIRDVELLINETLYKTVVDGFHSDLIKMAINNYEIKSKEKVSDISKGVDMAYSSLYSWGHGVSPVKMLQGQDIIEQIKKEGDSFYFQELAKTYLIENGHKSQVVLAPDENYIIKAQANEMEKIALEESNNDREKINVLMDNQNKLEVWQQKEEKVGSLPELNLDDINQSLALPKLKVIEDKKGKKMYYPADTNDLIYADLYFDTAYIPQESLNDLFLFANLISQKEKKLVALYTGGISCTAIAIPNFEWYNKYDPKLKLSISMEKDNIAKAFEILEQITRDEEWDEKWILTQIHKVRSQYENYFNGSPLEIMSAAIGSAQDGASRYEYEKLLPFYHYICEIDENYDQYKEQIINKLKLINQSVFNNKELVLGATLEEKNIKALEKNYEKYMKKLDNQTYPKANYVFDKKENKQGFPIASDVQYIVWGGNYKEKGGSYDGSLYVLANILNAEYMLPNIRVKNGAYGAGVKFNPYGNMSMYTYQDPKLAQSLQIIEAIPAYIAKLNITSDALDKYKIGAFSKFEQELGLNDHPVAIGETLQRYYLSGLTGEILEKVKEEIFSTTLSDTKQQGIVLEQLIKDGRYRVAGSNSKLLTNAHHFDIIQSFQTK